MTGTILRRGLAALALLAALPLSAQQVSRGAGAELRVLDKLTGETVDMLLLTGETGNLGFLHVTMEECRFPVNNPAGDAYVALVVRYGEDAVPAFAGWMIASSPALNAMDHPRYDVWALRCVDT